jgi:hypothetical protein
MFTVTYRLLQAARPESYRRPALLLVLHVTGRWCIVFFTAFTAEEKLIGHV